jgi:putative phosphoribosyl transferase
MPVMAQDGFGDRRFADRRAAGRELGEAVKLLQLDAPLVLALPRGGVPVAFEVAKALDAPLDLLLVRKLGSPGHAELGIGAITDGATPRVVLNQGLIQQLGVPEEYIRTEVDEQSAELERRRRAYLGGREPLAVKGQSVVLVDDGIATGSTVRVALEALRANGAAPLILAVPVAPASVLATLEPLTDGVICLATPTPFFAVGEHYEQFGQTTDDEVIQLLAQAGAHRAEGGDATPAAS